MIRTPFLSGTGTISANGGGSGSGVGGGGGRVALYSEMIDPIQNFDNLRAVTAFRGRANYDDRNASNGTVFIKDDEQANGNLFIDANVVDGSGNPNGTAAESTFLNGFAFGIAAGVNGNALTTDGEKPLLAGGMVGLRINPDLAQEESFIVSANTEDTVTVISPNEHGAIFSALASAGKIYGGVHHYDNLFFRRGGNLAVADSLIVPGSIQLEEYGLLTHLEATDSFISWLDVAVGNLLIDTTSRIDVTGRGYIGGRSGSESGRTLGNVFGSGQGAGGSYGGLGSRYSSYLPNAVYGNPSDPSDLGSGGGTWSGYFGGDGGGLALIQAGNITLNGAIISNGGESEGSAAGDGSGGTINIRTANLTGSGYFRANGGGMGNGVGGGGGRIAIRHTGAMSLPLPNIEASGGTGAYGGPAGPGSISIIP